MASPQLRVLITNDDGYQAPGIRALAPAIAELGYDVLLVAPLVDESGVGSAMAGTLGRPTIPARAEPTPLWSSSGATTRTSYPSSAIAGASARIPGAW